MSDVILVLVAIVLGLFILGRVLWFLLAATVGLVGVRAVRRARFRGRQ
ncbi:hypothetical protein [Streptomyces natalensis]|nr:hypothetical protein [Streptomyces natalensis]